jgi:peptidoglycan/LPS O-acetylase OafA/YrhL
MKYRKEIDGLRALAILPVILCHAGFQTFSGGYVGVDVFFVISGYLITSNIIIKKELGTFSLIAFYERRTRRILPALFFVLLACLPFSWVLLVPQDLKNFSASLAAVSTFTSNLFFQRTGYFEPAAALKPLLHTWSLAVEEQYYLLFPLLFVMFWRLGKLRTAACLAVLLLASLYGAYSLPINQPANAFFSLQTRGWELLLGSLVAFYPIKETSNNTRRSYNQLPSIIGLLLITYAVVKFDSQTPESGLYALIPTIGAAAIIVFADKQTIVGKLLTSRSFVGIGITSYSAYLWHQPILAYSRYWLDEPSKIAAMVLSTVALGIGAISWKYVETPFRDINRFSRRQIFIYGIFGSIIFVAIGITGHVLKGVPGRFTADEQEILATGNIEFKQVMAEYGLGKCFLGEDQTFEVLVSNKCVSNKNTRPRVIIFGDSEAAHWMVGAKTIFPKLGFEVEQWTAVGCRAIRNSMTTKRCENFYEGFLSNVIPNLSRLDTIIISGRWISTLKYIKRDAFLISIRNLFEKIKVSDAHIVVIGNAPEFSAAPHNLMVKNGIKNKGEVFLESMDFREVNDLLRIESKNHNFFYFDPTEVICDLKRSLRCLVAKDQVFYFLDLGHLSPAGSQVLIKELASRLSPLLKIH